MARLIAFVGALVSAVALGACAATPAPPPRLPDIVAPAPIPPLPPSAEVWGASLDDPHCLDGCPRSRSADARIIHRDLYVLSNNGETKLADWVAYVVSEELSGPERSRTWRADPDLNDEETLEPDDYDEAYPERGFDLGHQAPLASFSASPNWRETNFLSNITPQNSNLNRGRWARLERAERTLSARLDEHVYVVTGPLYESVMPALPNANESMRTPSGYWKIVALADGRYAGFIFENAPARETFCDAERGLAEIEARSGLDLFPSGTTSVSPTLAAGLGCR